MRAMTGIDVLDRGLDGGFPRPSSVLFFSEVIAEKRLFAEQFLVAGLQRGEVCLYVDFYRAPQFARHDLSKFGEYPPDNLVLVDATSSQLLVPSTEAYQIRDLESTTTIRDAVERAIRERKPGRVVVDSLDFLTERFPKEEVIALLKALLDLATEADCVMGILFLNWSYDREDLQEVLESADFLVEFKTSLKGGVILNKLRLTRREAEGPATNWIPFDFRDLAGLVLHFPRILVTGPYHAGKSTVVQQLSKSAVSVDRMGTTIAFDFGSLDISGVTVDLVGTPGQERFEFVFQIFAREVNGVLLVVDSTDRDSLTRARRMRELAGKSLPVVVLANKRDLPEALPLKTIRTALGLEKAVPLLGTVATDGEGLREGLERLIEIIIWGWPDA